MSRDLLFSVTKKDLRIDTFRSGGKGGQHQNKTDSGVRITHTASGAVGESREHRSQAQNRKAAFLRMVETDEFRTWHKTRSAEALGRLADLTAKVDRLMQKKNLRVEFRSTGGWWEEVNSDDC